MPTLNLNSEQLTNTEIAIGAANATYNLNNGGAYLVVGQPLVFAPDQVNVPGYTAKCKNGVRHDSFNRV